MITPDGDLNLRPGLTIPLEEFLERGEELLAVTPPEKATTIRGREGSLRLFTEEAFQQVRHRAEFMATLKERVAQAQAAAEAYRDDPTPEHEARLREALEGLAGLPPGTLSAKRSAP